MEAWGQKADREDAVLPAVVAEGDERAYATLYDRYGSVLLGLLHRILGSLREAEDVLLVAYFEGFAQTEIAARLDGPLGTIKSLARLGLEKLRRVLGLGRR